MGLGLGNFLEYHDLKKKKKGLFTAIGQRYQGPQPSFSEAAPNRPRAREPGCASVLPAFSATGNARRLAGLLGPPGLAAAGPGFQNLTDAKLGLFPPHLDHPPPSPRDYPSSPAQGKEGAKNRLAKLRKESIYFIWQKVKYLNTTIWSVGLEVTIAKYTVYVQPDGNPRFIKGTNVQ